MIREYRIPNKIESILRNYKGDRMNNFMLNTGHGQIVHIVKEFIANEWHKPAISIGISNNQSPEKMVKATFTNKNKLNMLIKLLENQRDTLSNE